MTPERWQQVKNLLEGALELAPEERAAFLSRSCSLDPSLRQEVDTLLSASDEVRSSFLESSAMHSTLTPGTRLGDYEVQKLLGSGGMGEVYRARDTRLRREVAIKVLPKFLSSDNERLRRFEQEAQAAAALNHPNILAIFQMGTYGGSPYIVSELLEGETLREVIKRGPLPARKVIEQTAQIAQGLAAAHEKGIVHRDLKPENLFATKDGRIKILDFGLAKLKQAGGVGPNSALTLGANGTEPGMVMGTAGYMAPEQVRGQPADHRADIFAFGAILYELLTGRRAFHKTTAADTMAAILNEEPPTASQTVRNIPPALHRTIDRCLEKSPEQRFQSASDLAFALEALSDSTASTSSPREPGPLSKPIKLRVVLAVAGVAVFLVAIFLAANVGGVRDRLWGPSQANKIQSLLVLPLQNLSRDPEQEYFVDGMTEELISSLARIGSLRVISRTSAMHYKDTSKTIPEIARELNVDAIIEGTVQRSGDRVRITAELIQGSSDQNLWSNSYERDMRDVFAIEQDVTADIARQIQARLTTQTQLTLPPSRSVDPKAMEAYLQGNYYMYQYGRGGGDEETRKAAEYFQRAIDVDPSFAAAYNGLANAHQGLMWPTSDDVQIAAKATEKALALDPTSVDALVNLAGRRLSRWDFTGAEQDYRRVIALNPNNAVAHESFCNFLFALGRGEEGMKECQVAQALDPAIDHLSNAFYMAGEYARAISIAQIHLQTDPNDVGAHYVLARAYTADGKLREGIEHGAKVFALMGDSESAARIIHTLEVSGPRNAWLEAARVEELWIKTKRGYQPVDTAMVFAVCGDRDRAFYWLEEAYRNHDKQWVSLDLGLESLNSEPLFDPLRSDPRFKDLLRRIGLPDTRMPGHKS